MPSPVCTVNSGAVPANVTANASVTIALANAAGAAFWGIIATSTDELNTAAAVNATLVVNQTAKTATFTAPSTLGSAVIFQSTVGVSLRSVQGAGRDVNGTLQPSYTTTFKVNVLTGSSLSVVAASEVIEQSTVAGWLASINPAIRAAGSGGGGGATFWPYNTTIPGSIAAPVLSQAQDTTGTTPSITIQSAAAKTGSGNNGGNVVFIGGEGDGLSGGYPSSQQGFYYSLNTTGSPLPTYGGDFALARLFYSAGGAVIYTLGGGMNGVGAGVAGVEISCYSELSIATEGGLINFAAINDPHNLDATLFMQPCVNDGTNEAGFAFTVNILHPTSGDASCVQVLAVESGAFGTGTLRYYDAQLGGVRRFSFNEQAGYASLAFYDTSGQTANEQSFISVPYGPTSGTPDIGIVVQRNSANTGDLEIITRQTGELYFGSYSENNRYHALNQVDFELFNTGLGFNFSNPVSGTIAAFRSDTQKTIVHGSPDLGKDGCIAQFYFANTTSTSAGQQIALVQLWAGVNQIHWVLTAQDTTGTNFASFEITTCYNSNGTSVITNPSAAATVTDTGHSTGAGTSIAPTLVPTVTGGVTYLSVTVTPWTTNQIHWSLRAVTVVNTGTF